MGGIAFDRLRRDPVLHIERIQGVSSLEPFQANICRAIRDHERVAVSACHDLGKTFTVAKIVLWAGSVFPRSKIITTAPTWLQVDKLLWSEIRSGFRNSRHPLGGRMLSTEWKIDDDWFAIGMSPKDDAEGAQGQGQGSRFQGFHGDMVIIVFDEATGIHKKRWIQADGMMTSANVKWIAIGNPTSRASEFYRCFSSPEWHKIYLSCFDSPNLIANGITSMTKLTEVVEAYKACDDQKKQDFLKVFKVVHPKLLTVKWVVQKAASWGLDHPLTLSKILGQFPKEDENTLIPLSVVEQAVLRGQEHKPHFDPINRSIGVDPARFGIDASVITVIEDGKQTIRKSVKKADTSEVAGMVTRLANDLKPANKESITVDSTGIGAGVVDQLRQSQSNGRFRSQMVITEVHFGQACPEESDKEHYSNLKAKMFVQLADDLKSNLALSDDSVYSEELPTVLYKFDQKGRYVIESKDDYKKRTGLKSPDNADSLVIANYGRYDHGIGRFTTQLVESVKRTSTIAGGRNVAKW